jgi:hypothetical protein
LPATVLEFTTTSLSWHRELVLSPVLADPGS